MAVPLVAQLDVVPCPICHDEGGAEWVQHPAPFSLEHRVHRNCFENWYNQNHNSACLFACGQNYPVPGIVPQNVRAVAPINMRPVLQNVEPIEPMNVVLCAAVALSALVLFTDALRQLNRWIQLIPPLVNLTFGFPSIVYSVALGVLVSLKYGPRTHSYGQVAFCSAFFYLSRSQFPLIFLISSIAGALAFYRNRR